jgi:hypothetical protein
MTSTAIIRSFGTLAALPGHIRERPGLSGDGQVFLVDHRLAPPSRPSLTVTHPVHATEPGKRVCTAPNYIWRIVHCNFHLIRDLLPVLELKTVRNNLERREHTRTANTIRHIRTNFGKRPASRSYRVYRFDPQSGGGTMFWLVVEPTTGTCKQSTLVCQYRF